MKVIQTSARWISEGRRQTQLQRWTDYKRQTDRPDHTAMQTDIQINSRGPFRKADSLVARLGRAASTGRVEGCSTALEPNMRLLYHR